MNEQIKALVANTGYRNPDGEWQFADDCHVEEFSHLIVKKDSERILRAAL